MTVEVAGRVESRWVPANANSVDRPFAGSRVILTCLGHARVSLLGHRGEGMEELPMDKLVGKVFVVGLDEFSGNFNHHHRSLACHQLLP